MVLSKKEIKDLLETSFTHIKKLIQLWHEKTLEHIRLTSANKKHLADYKQKQIEQGMLLKKKLIEQSRRR